MNRLVHTDWLWIAGLTASFVVSRLLWVQLFPGSAAYWEEDYRYVAALELFSAPVQPFMDYQADHYQGGSLVMISIAGMLFRLFWPSVVMLKLAAILFSTAIVALVYAVCAKLFDRKVAAISALAYLAGPPLLAYWGLVPMGSHSESVAFSFVQILVLGGLVTGEWRRPAGWLGFGFTAGLGVWFCYTAGMTTLACAVAWLMLRGLPKLRELGATALGFAVGLVPWAAYNLAHDFAGLRRVAEIFGGGDPIDRWIHVSAGEKLNDFILRDLPTGWIVPLGSDSSATVQLALQLAYLVPFALGLAWAIGRTMRAPISDLLGSIRVTQSSAAGSSGPLPEPAREHELAFVLYAGVFLAVFLGSSFAIDPNGHPVKYRMFLPIGILLVPPVARSAALWMSARGVRRTAASMLTAVALLASGISTLLTATRSVPSELPDPLISGSAARGLLIHRKYEGDPGPALALLRAIEDPEARKVAFGGFGWGLEYRYETDGDFARIQNWLAIVPVEEQTLMVGGLRFWGTIRLGQLGELIRAGHGSKLERKTVARLKLLLDHTSAGYVPSTAGSLFH